MLHLGDDAILRSFSDRRTLTLLEGATAAKKRTYVWQRQQTGSERARHVVFIATDVNQRTDGTNDSLSGNDKTSAGGEILACEIHGRERRT
jgi:hypothetical protein